MKEIVNRGGVEGIGMLAGCDGRVVGGLLVNITEQGAYHRSRFQIPRMGLCNSATERQRERSIVRSSEHILLLQT